MRPTLPSDEGAIYCRIPHLRCRDQTTVDRRERGCRELAWELGIQVDPRHVYLDTRAMSWQRDRTRSGWEAMLAAARAGAFRHLVCYEPEQLIWQPFDLVELLRTAEAHGILLHGCVAGRDLTDPEQRRLLLGDAERACRAASGVSATAKAAHELTAARGRPHGGGRRAYGYEAGTYRLIEAEALIVREIYSRFLAGESTRGVPTSGGRRWTVGGVARVLDAPRYAGLRVFRGGVLREPDGGYVRATWEPCVSDAEWEQVRDLRESRSQASAVGQRPPRLYPLTGLLLCARCDRHMVGHMIGTYPFYSCTAKSGLATDRCRRHIAAGRLEAFVAESAVTALEQWQGGDNIAPLSAPDPADGHLADLDTDLEHLAQLAGLRENERLTPAEYVTLRAAALKRVRAVHFGVRVRPVEALDGVATGPDARFHWHRLPPERRATVLRLLFSSIRIGPSATGPGVFDYDRINLIGYSPPGPTG
ncbi:recombinase family protein [Kitasatospora sp. NPDC004669]|uniref:recombinase family protein n=1 Tax=Kitasatospora sp. NPDC004669 TaxID=3154555 RepID=UPI0033B76FD7